MRESVGVVAGKEDFKGVRGVYHRAHRLWHCKKRLAFPVSGVCECGFLAQANELLRYFNV